MRYNLRIRNKTIKYKSSKLIVQEKSVRQVLNKRPLKEIRALKTNLEFRIVKLLSNRGKSPKRQFSVDISNTLSNYLRSKYAINNKYLNSIQFYEDFDLDYKR